MKLQRDLGIFQKAACRSAHHVSECCRTAIEHFMGPVEADKSYIGGKAKNVHARRVQAERITSRGADDKATVAGVKDRATDVVAARVIELTYAATLQGLVLAALTAP